MTPSRTRTCASCFVVAGWLAVSACSDSRPAEAPPAPPRTTAPTGTPTPVGAADEARASAETSARELLDRWLVAQNAGDFEAYSALYASRFTGVKRTPDRTVAFDRDGWMRDRRRMFGRPMTVAVSDVAIRATSSMVSILFTQRFASGRYSDEGQKRISLVREEGRWVIATEEMLASSRLGEAEAALTVGTFVAVPAGEGALAIVAPAHENEATGTPVLLSSEEPFVVVRETTSAIPASVAALQGREVTVVERDRTCTGRVSNVRIARLVVPHFGMVQRWNGDDGGMAVRPASESERAAEAWALGTTSYYAAVVASECRHPVAVTFAPRETVQSFAPRVPTLAERSALRRAFERTSRFAALERSYVDYRTEWTPDEAPPAPPAQRAAWAEAASTVVFEREGRAVATVVHNSEGCGGFDASAWASFELGARGPVEHRVRGSIGDYVSVVAVFDVEGDGALEAVIRRGLASYALVRLTPAASVIRAVEVDYLDCAC